MRFANDPPALRLFFRKGLNVCFARAEEIKKIQSLVFAGLADAEQDEILTCPPQAVLMIIIATAFVSTPKSFHAYNEPVVTLGYELGESAWPTAQMMQFLLDSPEILSGCCHKLATTAMTKLWSIIGLAPTTATFFRSSVAPAGRAQLVKLVPMT